MIVRNRPARGQRKSADLHMTGRVVRPEARNPCDSAGCHRNAQRLPSGGLAVRFAGPRQETQHKPQICGVTRVTTWIRSASRNPKTVTETKRRTPESAPSDGARSLLVARRLSKPRWVSRLLRQAILSTVAVSCRKGRPALRVWIKTTRGCLGAWCSGAGSNATDSRASTVAHPCSCGVLAPPAFRWRVDGVGYR
ncbi:hypothetical protein GQ53DRAFT_467709 [Thozetella sp. PMI_491]|nr:hypothetical protein GQ53DRAFT_467709 [Thozetella sp. PMI_491]